MPTYPNPGPKRKGAGLTADFVEDFRPETLRIDTEEFAGMRKRAQPNDVRLSQVSFAQLQVIEPSPSGMLLVRWDPTARARTMAEDFLKKMGWTRESLGNSGFIPDDKKRAVAEMQAQLPVGEWSGMIFVTPENAKRLQLAWDHWKAKNPGTREGKASAT